MGIIDTPDMRKEKHIRSHSLVLVKRSAVKSAYNVFVASKKNTRS